MDVNLISDIEKWPIAADGLSFTFTGVQKLALDFIDLSCSKGLRPILFMPMGCGKTILGMTLTAYNAGSYKYGQKVVCSTQSCASHRRRWMDELVKTPAYRERFPHNSEVKFSGVVSHGLDYEPGAMFFDDISTYENSVLTPNAGKGIYVRVMEFWLPRSFVDVGRPVKVSRAFFFGRVFTRKDPLMRLAAHPGFSRMKVGVNRDFTAYNVEMWNIERGHFLQLYERHAIGKGVVTDAKDEPDAMMETRLSRPRAWYREQHRLDPELFDHIYRSDFHPEAPPSTVNT